MRKNLLLLTAILISTILNAQIAISSSDFPSGGDSILISITNNIGLNDPTVAGPAFYFDYSSLTSTSTMQEAFDAPAAFPSIYMYLFNPFNTTYGKNNTSLTTIPIPGISFSAAYDFIKKSSSTLKQIGAGYIINGLPLPLIYSQPDILYRFPMLYLNRDSCNFKYSLTIPSMGYYGETGHRLNEIDGWGTLITPADTFQTLRVKTTISATDTVYIDSISFGIKIPRPIRYEYKWFANGKIAPVLEIDAADVAGIPVVNNVKYFDIAPIVTPPPVNPHVYPVSATSSPFQNFEIVEPGYNSVAKIWVSDLLGRTVAQIGDTNKIGATLQQPINFESLSLSPGIYLLIADADNQRQVKKIIITK